MNPYAVGDLLREWRGLRRRSQLDLALDVGVSPRHLSFVETGRSTPSAELVLALAEGLEVPLRERNSMLLAAGYAPRFSERSLDDPEMQPIRSTLQRLLDAHDPYPGVVIDRQWNVVLTNPAALALTAALPAALLGPPLNVYRACLHPDGLAARTINLDTWANYLLGQLRRTITLTGDPQLRELEREILHYPNLTDHVPPPVGREPEASLLVPLRLATDDGELAMFTTLTTFGTPRDVTLDELAIELFYPADSRSERWLRRGSNQQVRS